MNSSQFTDAQSRAIAHGTGPAMILAGPGSGKTLVITQRTKYLINEYQVSPDHILVITFTKAAALEMQQRFASVSDAKGVTFGTFHSVFYYILKNAYQLNQSNILTEEEKYQIIKGLLPQKEMRQEEERDLIFDLIGEISLVKNERINLSYYYASCCSDEVFREIFQKYIDICRQMSKLDFDDMLTYTYALFQNRPDILKLWQQKFTYILVDEFQDINAIQYQIMKLLAGETNNLFIVGDDDQSIYRFRGAKPEIMQQFQKENQECVRIVLDHNFRSTAPILNAADSVIRENTDRFEKTMIHTREGGEAVDIREFQNQEHETLHLVKEIKNREAQGQSLQNFAVLFRTNKGAGAFAQRFMEFNIPFEMRDALPNIYEHWVGKDLLTYIRLAVQGLSREGFLQIMNRPLRYINRAALDDSYFDFETLKTYYHDKDWMVERLDRMEFDFGLIRNMTPFAAINFIRNGMHYADYLTEYAKEHRMRIEELTDIADEIQQCAKPFRTFTEWFEYIDAYKQKLEERKGSGKRNREDAVLFATLHSAKGLEFKEVFLVDVNEGTIPHRKSNTDADIEEERRLLYVGMTRAQEKLHIYYTKEHFGKRIEPSRFLTSLLDRMEQ